MFHQTGKVSKDWTGFDEMDMADEIRTNVRLYGDWTGFHHVRLACSRDLCNWTRLGDRKPFIDLSPMDGVAYDTQVIMPPSNAVIHGDELWFYYTGTRNYAYVSSDAPDSGGAVCLAALRRDGFVSLDADDGGGTLQTSPFILPGNKLYVNLDARNGSLIVEVLNNANDVSAKSVCLTGDVLSAEIEWKQGNLVNAHHKSISLRFTLNNGSLYSYWFE